ncbi:hypothetical protein NX059_001131 [Plenodomus lindquistii]|nr:hypothetical protein NX059_001131 [Plenodomus lindquistii]
MSELSPTRPTRRGPEVDPPVKVRVKCTYKDCDLWFNDEKTMKRHKRHSDEHDYCHLCDEDFEDVDAYIQHKIIRPDNHDRACRVCGEEFKSEAGLKRHIELNHRVDQKLVCIGCHQSFHRACLFIEHLEFGHCDVISPNQFHGHIVHKHLITEFLKGGEALARFKQKTSKYDAAIDYEEEGGIELEQDPLDVDEAIEEVNFEAIKPETPPETPQSQAFTGPYPPLPSQIGKDWSQVASSIGTMSISGESEASTIIGSPATATFGTVNGESSHAGSSVQGSSVTSSSRRPKAWGSRVGKTTSSILFPNAKPTPAPSEFSIAAHDESMQGQVGINIMNTRFWDPLSSDWNPEQFFDSVITKYSCPFICEQTFETVSNLNQHILGDHRITRMKCPTCLHYFKSATALVAHCESRGAKCQINKAEDFNKFLSQISGGFLEVKEMTRKDHVDHELNRPRFITNPETQRMERYQPVVATYLQYNVSTPPDWKEPAKVGVQIGGLPRKTDAW